MPEDSFIEKQERNISSHIFPVSAGLVGVCLTVISLINIITEIKKITTFGDDLTAIDALFFIFSCFLSYCAMKTRDKKKQLALEKIADTLFLLGLSLMTLVCFFVVYLLSK